MQRVLEIFGWYLVFEGILLVAWPVAVHDVAETLLDGGVHRGWGVLAFSVGGVLCWAAPASTISTVIWIVGGLAIIKGVLFVLGPASWLTGCIRWWQHLPQVAHRVWGLAIGALGMLIVGTVPI